MRGIIWPVPLSFPGEFYESTATQAASPGEWYAVSAYCLAPACDSIGHGFIGNGLTAITRHDICVPINWASDCTLSLWSITGRYRDTASGRAGAPRTVRNNGRA